MTFYLNALFGLLSAVIVGFLFTWKAERPDYWTLGRMVALVVHVPILMIVHGWIHLKFDGGLAQNFLPYWLILTFGMCVTGFIRNNRRGVLPWHRVWFYWWKYGEDWKTKVDKRK